MVRLSGKDLKLEELSSSIEQLLSSPPDKDVFPTCRVSDCAALLSAALDRAVYDK